MFVRGQITSFIQTRISQCYQTREFFNCLPEMTDVFKLLEIRFILKEQTFIRQWKFNNCGAFSVVFPQVAVP